jgi:hypothetical protein
MCHGYGGGYPDPGGYVIASLKKGDEITLQPGFGYPKVDKERTLIVYEVYQFSALCTDGTRLMCRDGNGVTATGQSLKAKAGIKVYLVLLDTFVNKSTRWFGERVEKIKTEIWWIQHRFKKSRKAKRA